jgi:hypothetical protein
LKRNAFLAVLATACLVAGQAWAQKVETRIAGRWKLNQQRSDKLPPADQMPGAFGTQWGGQPPRPPAGDPPEGGEKGAEATRERRQGGMRFSGMSDMALRMEARNPPQELTIELTDSTASITDENGLGQEWPTDGRKVEEPTGGARTLKTQAGWKDGDLRVEKQVSGTDTKLRLTFRYDQVTTRLTLLIRLETGRDMPAEIRLVYDRIEAGVPPGN